MLKMITFFLPSFFFNLLTLGYLRPDVYYFLRYTCPEEICDSDPAVWLLVPGCRCLHCCLHHHHHLLMSCCCCWCNRTPEPFVPWTFPPWTRYHTAFVPDSWSRIVNPWTAGPRSRPAIDGARWKWRCLNAVCMICRQQQGFQYLHLIANVIKRRREMRKMSVRTWSDNTTSWGHEIHD